MYMYSFTLFLVAFINIHIICASEEESASEVINDENYIECNTVECAEAALFVASSLDRTVDPCDNFYQFACGGWVKDHPVNTTHQTINAFAAWNRKTTEHIKEILEDDSKPNDILALRKARNLHKLCMRDDELQSIGVRALNRVLEQNGGWPMIMSTEEWQSKQLYIWQQYSDSLQENVFYNGLYDIRVTIDEKESSNHVIIIWDPIPYIPCEILIDFEQDFSQKMIYVSYIQEVAQILMDERGVYVENTTLAQNIQDIVDFEIQLAKLMMSSEDKRNIDKTYNERTIEQLQQEYNAKNPVKSQINWYDTIKKIFAREEITIELSEKLVVQAYEYLMKLVPLLDQTSTRTIVNYMQWTFLRDWIAFADSRMETISMQMDQQYRGIEADSERWERCLKKQNLKKAISYEYSKRYIQHESKEDVDNMIANIKDVVRNEISASTWMDNDTKIVSYDKLDNMNAQVSAPDWYDPEAIDRYYEDLSIVNEYLASAMNLHKFEKSKMLRELRKPVDKNEWDIEPTMTDAFYKTASNTIVITAAVLQGPVYGKNRPAFMNYGSLGIIIGHEVNHGFDDIGRMFDKDGNAVQWWTNDSVNKYEQLAKCFEDQYNGYKFPGLEASDKIVYVNGKVSLGENIGDSAGAAAAYNAYKNRKTKLNELEIRLPGLEEYTNDQIFFMSFACMICDNVTPQVAQLFSLYAHPRPETRIIGSLSNFPGFAKAYNCPAGKEMNPDKKCALWQ